MIHSKRCVVVNNLRIYREKLGPVVMPYVPWLDLMSRANILGLLFNRLCCVETFLLPSKQPKSKDSGMIRGTRCAVDNNYTHL
jgi:hypothetical protein